MATLIRTFTGNGENEANAATMATNAAQQWIDAAGAPVKSVSTSLTATVVQTKAKPAYEYAFAITIVLEPVNTQQSR